MFHYPELRAPQLLPNYRKVEFVGIQVNVLLRLSKSNERLHIYLLQSIQIKHHLYLLFWQLRLLFFRIKDVRLILRRLAHSRNCLLSRVLSTGVGILVYLP